jgi:hypothetical protein
MAIGNGFQEWSIFVTYTQQDQQMAQKASISVHMNVGKSSYLVAMPFFDFRQ